MLFLNKDPELAKAARRIVEEELQLETLSIVGWRDVPTNEGVLGEIALSSLPRIEQIFVNARLAGARAIWSAVCLLRVVALKNACRKTRISTFVACPIWSTSIKVCVCRRICRASTDLADLRPESAICLFHQRFSTNTVPRWPLAQPFRYRRTTVKLTPLPATASGPRPYL